MEVGEHGAERNVKVRSGMEALARELDMATCRLVGVLDMEMEGGARVGAWR